MESQLIQEMNDVDELIADHARALNQEQPRFYDERLRVTMEDKR